MRGVGLEGRDDGPAGSGQAFLRTPGRWERLFADLDASAEEADRAELDAELVDRARGELGRIRLVDRLRAAIGHPVAVTLTGGMTLNGLLREVGPDWLLTSEVAGREALVSLPAVCTFNGLGALSAVPQSEGRVTAKLDLRYALRRLARDRAAVATTLTDGSVLFGTCDRVGADFFELAEHSAGEPRRAGAVRGVRTVPLSAFALARPG
jgi:hypothetical protein